MLVTKHADIVADLAARYGLDAEVVLSELVKLGGGDVLAHHLRSAFARVREIDPPGAAATWESRV